MGKFGKKPWAEPDSREEPSLLFPAPFVSFNDQHDQSVSILANEISPGGVAVLRWQLRWCVASGANGEEQQTAMEGRGGR